MRERTPLGPKPCPIDVILESIENLDMRRSGDHIAFKLSYPKTDDGFSAAIFINLIFSIEHGVWTSNVIHTDDCYVVLAVIYSPMHELN